ncbi:MAG: hypothetical protein JRE81_10995 [Deltaproteobacteria bacterium]|jgi:hypothetical protein|nr:hypothetical protein [Deltaproteobacteria bacterium]
MTFGAREILAGLLLMVVGAATAKGDEPRAPCAWRTGEKLGIGFAEICTPTSAPKGLLEESPAEIAPFWMSAAPLPCSRGSGGTIDCPVATAILSARSRAKDVLEPRSVALVDGKTAYGVCGMRFGGRLPTRAERELARYSASVATLVAIKEPDEPEPFVGELPEWTQVGDCTNPSQPDEGCRLVIFPPVLTRERSKHSVLQACQASFAPGSIETAIQPGASCVGGSCTVRILPALRPEAFELTCQPIDIRVTEAPAEPNAEQAAFRCVVPESALGVVGGKTAR